MDNAATAPANTSATAPDEDPLDHYREVQTLGPNAAKHHHDDSDELRVVKRVSVPPQLSPVDVAAIAKRHHGVLTRLSSPYLVKVVEVFSSPRDPHSVFVVSECMESQPFMRPQAGGVYTALPERLVVHYGFQVAAALKYLHSRRVAHRNINPSNVLLDADHRIRLIGISLRGQLRQGLHPIADNPHFTAPELFWVTDNSDIDHCRTDAWEFGVLLHLMLFGRFPFEADSAEALQYRIRRSTVTLMPHPNTQLVKVLSGTLQRDPKKRMSMAAAARILEEENHRLAREDAIDSAQQSCLPLPLGSGTPSTQQHTPPQHARRSTSPAATSNTSRPVELLPRANTFGTSMSTPLSTAQDTGASDAPRSRVSDTTDEGMVSPLLPSPATTQNTAAPPGGSPSEGSSPRRLESHSPTRHTPAAPRIAPPDTATSPSFRSFYAVGRHERAALTQPIVTRYGRTSLLDRIARTRLVRTPRDRPATGGTTSSTQPNVNTPHASDSSQRTSAGPNTL